MLAVWLCFPCNFMLCMFYFSVCRQWGVGAGCKEGWGLGGLAVSSWLPQSEFKSLVNFMLIFPHHSPFLPPSLPQCIVVRAWPPRRPSMPPLGALSDVATRLTGLRNGHQNEWALGQMAALLRCDSSDLVDGEWSAFVYAFILASSRLINGILKHTVWGRAQGTGITLS